MNHRGIKEILIIGIMALLLCITCTAVLPCGKAFAATGNVSANCDTQTMQKGDTVEIKVSTRSMKISTFIASVEYDGDALEYQGYYGNDKKDKTNVYLAKKGDSAVHLDIAVEKNEDDSIIGMYGIGTAEKSYTAAEPLVTLVFKAKKSGDVAYTTTESTSGKDGYTSDETVANAAGTAGDAEAAEQVAEEYRTDQRMESTKSYAGYIAVGAAVVLVALVIAIKKRNT